MTRRKIQNPQRALHRDITPVRLATGCLIIDQQSIREDFLCKSNRLPLSAAEGGRQFR